MHFAIELLFCNPSTWRRILRCRSKPSSLDNPSPHSRAFSSSAELRVVRRDNISSKRKRLLALRAKLGRPELVHEDTAARFCNACFNLFTGLGACPLMPSHRLQSHTPARLLAHHQHNALHDRIITHHTSQQNFRLKKDCFALKSSRILASPRAADPDVVYSRQFHVIHSLKVFVHVIYWLSSFTQSQTIVPPVMLPSIVPRIQQKVMEHQVVANSPKLMAMLGHPAGPFTVHFWAPTIKWAISIANVADMRRSPETISVAQQTAVTATGLIWSRYSMVITPKNWNLFAVNVFMAGTGLVQFYRKFTYDPKQNAAVAKSA